MAKYVMLTLGFRLSHLSMLITVVNIMILHALKLFRFLNLRGSLSNT